MKLKLTVGTHNEANREAWIKRQLSEIASGSRILDAGAGQLKYKSYCGHLNYVSQDFCEYKGKGNTQGLQYDYWDTSRIDIVCDIVQIPEPDGSFDAILCTEVFEHIPNPLLALQEFYRLLKPNGLLIITAPFNSLTHFAPYFFSTGFSSYFYQHHLPPIGFEMIEITPNGNYFEYLAQEMRRLPSIGKKYANQKLSWVNRLIIKFILLTFQRLSDNDKGSNELLCYGYMIKARRL